MKPGGGSEPPPLEVIDMKLLLRGCPRCRGTLELTKDLGMYTWTCVNCSREYPVKRLEPEPSRQDQRPQERTEN